jgi:SAM-dependent methyltransferase
MGINALQVAWISRLAEKALIRRGDSMVEFGPQDVFCSRQAVEIHGCKHCEPSKLSALLEEMFDGQTRRNIVPSAFYSIFGVTRYRSVDLFDPRADWIRDCNVPFTLPEQFDIVTNFGTAEHVFNISAVFCSMHDIVRTGGIMLHVLPTFGDIDHGFYNIHPTVYFDLAAANNYKIEDICYVDRWDIRNCRYEADLMAGVDFDGFPIRVEHLKDRSTLQRMVTRQFVENYGHPDTILYGPHFDSIYYDYCIVAMRKLENRSFRFSVQGIYGVKATSPLAINSPTMLKAYTLSRRTKANMKEAIKRYIFPLIPSYLRERLLNYVRTRRS